MSDKRPDGPYIYQPFGMQDKLNWQAQRIYALGGLPRLAVVRGLTRDEAERVLAALSAPAEREDEVERARSRLGVACRDRIWWMVHYGSGDDAYPEKERAESEAYRALLAAESARRGGKGE